MVEGKIHKSLSDTTRDILENTSLVFRCKLGEILDARGLSQTELSILTGIRQASINDMIHGKKNTINKQHVAVIMYVLRLKEFSQLYEVKYSNVDDEIMMEEDGHYVEMNGLLPEQDELLASHRKKD